MKVWITKNVIIRGIFEEEVEDCGNDMVKEKKGFLHPACYYKEGVEWHRTKESAIAKAEEIRAKKIQELKKRIKELEEMKFE